jgi:hypothetical protein
MAEIETLTRIVSYDIDYDELRLNSTPISRR